MECLSVALAQKEKRYTLKNESQKNLIKIILHHSSLDLKSFAEILEINPLTLSHVANGKDHLDINTFKRLVDWFFIFING
ncbi:TPA: hypothetical protein ACT9AQ_001166 [Legionella pneumophila]|nr:hypothetical protein [Legionella pneumophila]HDO8078941.1 hypothetical protein [Legionella pneumophila]HDO8153379.1 hypothetical protein [Legionella pneumophila]